ncbi:MAG: hypothetical protein IKR13_07025 [Victivallales bacterium]|nr:hypothetical protein [Victivallales bacterium]
MKQIRVLLLAALLAFSGVSFAAESAEGGAPSASPQVVTIQKDPVKQLRGKLLYKKNQIRKLERAALAADPTLEEKVNQLENQRQSLYVAVAPDLAELYAAEKDLQGQIDAAKPTK